MPQISLTKIEALNKFSVPFKKNILERTSVMRELSMEQCLNDGKTLHELFMRGVRISGDKPCLGWRRGLDRPYKWITYNEVLERSQWIGSGLIAVGAQPKPSQFIGFISVNSVEHMIARQACNNFSMAMVPILELANFEWMEYIVELCELKIIFIDTLLRAKNLFSLLISGEISLDIIVVNESLDDRIIDLGKNHTVKIMDFATLESIGKANIHDFVPPKPEDLHVISFTSGATGTPNGVMLTHKNFAVCTYSILALVKLNYFDLSEKDVYFSFVSLSTPFESVLKGVMFAIGARIGFFSGNFVNILSDVTELKPTIFPCIPQFLNTVYKANMSMIDHSFIMALILKTALKSKMKLLNKGIQSTQTLWDFLVLKRIRNKLGGKVKVFLTGTKSANMASFNFMKCVFGAKTILTYGSTETTSFVSYSHPLDLSPGSVGPPFACSVVKLIDAPKQQCFLKDGIGEICVKGGNVFSGYYKDETLTKEAIDADGWFHTGDIGTWLSNGALKIIDRKQNVFIMTNGYKIFPEKIELVFCDISFIHQIFIYGDRDHSYIVAVVVIDTGFLNSWCAKKKIKLNITEYSDDSAVVSAVIKEIKWVGIQNGLKPYEIPVNIFTTDEYFTTENGLLTPSQKPKRNEIYLKYRHEINEMFD